MSLIDDIRTRGAELRERVRELLSQHRYSGGAKTVLLVGYVNIALEHHAAIWLLMEIELPGSAFALVRPMFDCWVRALWINGIATEQQSEQARLDKLRFPEMREMLEAIKPVYSQLDTREDIDKLFKYVRRQWGIWSSYTHAGGRLIDRCFSEDQVEWSFTDREIAQVYNLATVVLMLLMRAFFLSMGHQRDANETYALLTQYAAQFNERLNKGE